MKIYSNGPGHLPIWLPCLYIVKTFKNLLMNRKANDLESWYAALGTEVLPNLFKWWPCFCMGESLYSIWSCISKVVWFQNIQCTQVSDTGPHGPLDIFFLALNLLDPNNSVFILIHLWVEALHADRTSMCIWTTAEPRVSDSLMSRGPSHGPNFYVYMNHCRT